MRAHITMNFIDRFLNNITMYRLVMYYLIILLAIAAIFGAVGILPYSPIAIIFSTLFLVLVAWVANGICATIMKVPQNSESVYITALILALIITPGMPTRRLDRHLPRMGGGARDGVKICFDDR